MTFFLNIFCIPHRISQIRSKSYQFEQNSIIPKTVSIEQAEPQSSQTPRAVLQPASILHPRPVTRGLQMLPDPSAGILLAGPSPQVLRFRCSYYRQASSITDALVWDLTLPTLDPSPQEAEKRWKAASIPLAWAKQLV